MDNIGKSGQKRIGAFAMTSSRERPMSRLDIHRHEKSKKDKKDKKSLELKSTENQRVTPKT
jgi:hypothetical protein